MYAYSNATSRQLIISCTSMSADATHRNTTQIYKLFSIKSPLSLVWIGPVSRSYIGDPEDQEHAKELSEELFEEDREIERN